MSAELWTGDPSETDTYSCADLLSHQCHQYHPGPSPAPPTPSCDFEDCYYIERLTSLRNLCDIATILRMGKQYGLLPTITEEIFEKAQALCDDYCVL